MSRKMDAYLVSASGAAVLAVYLAGYSRTAAAPDRLLTAVPDAQLRAAQKWKDGTYSGWGYSRHGNLEATVTIRDGRIAEAVISQCLTRYPCSVIDMLPQQVKQRQSAIVDYVSRATESAEAFYEAVVAALGKAQ